MTSFAFNPLLTVNLNNSRMGESFAFHRIPQLVHAYLSILEIVDRFLELDHQADLIL
jgi:hypothetical protein